MSSEQDGHGQDEASAQSSAQSSTPPDEVGIADNTRAAGVPDHTVTIPALDADTEEMTAEDAATVEGLPPGSALLLVQRGPGAGARFLLDTESVTVGRHPQSDIFLDDITVSRRHATFERRGDGYAVTDLGSLNGTYVNRDRIEREVVLHSNDEVQIGKYRLIYFVGTLGSQG